MVKCKVVCIWFALILGNFCVAQKNNNYNKLYTKIGVTPFYSLNNPYKIYIPSTGIDFYIGSNVGKGIVLLNLQHFKQTSDSLPHFKSYLFTLGYALKFKLVKQLFISPEVALGNHYIIFENNHSDNLKYESEIMGSAAISLSYNINNKLSCVITARKSHTFYYHPLNINSASIGFCYQFNTPTILKKLLD